MTDEDRERGRIEALLAGLDGEVEKLRDRSHRHASKIQASANWITVFREQDLDKRLKALEGWRQWQLGAMAAASVLGGAVVAIIDRLIR